MATKEVANAVQYENTGSKEFSFNSLYHKVCKQLSLQEFKRTYKWYKENRGGKVDWDRVHEIARSIVYNNTGWLVMPIIVDAKSKTVLEGWHTGHALEEVEEKYGIKVIIIVVEVNLPENVTVGDAVKMYNNKRKGWTLEMFILDYILHGVPDYKRLKEMAEKLGDFFIDEDGKIRWRYVSSLCGKCQQDELRDGTYTLSKKDMDAQMVTGTEILGLWEAAGKPKIGPWMEGFIIAWCKLKDMFGKSLNYEKFKTKVANHKNEFDGANPAKVWSERFGAWMQD